MDYIKKLLKKEVVRYIIAGGFTTVVNLVSFYALRIFTDFSRNTANIIAISLAIMFAFFANKFFVFSSSKKDGSTFISELLAFWGGRLVSMVVEIVGTNLLCDSFRCNEFVSKLIVQFLVMAINYFFGKFIVFKEEKRSIIDIVTENYILVFAFALPALFMLGLWIVGEVGPFGGHSLTMVDSLHQYLPFFSDYYDKLSNEGSLFYTWNIGLGSNMLSIIAYYIACPANFIILLFDQSHIYIGMSLLISVKIALSGMTFAYYLEKKLDAKNNWLILIFSCAYALSNYVIGYSWNVMWMDCILILPLIMTGFDSLMESGSYKMYVWSLFYGLLCNYYICFMICIFLVLEFLLTNHKTVRKFFTDGFQFAGCSLLSAAMASFILIPAYLGINTTASATRDFPKSSWYGSMWDMVKQIFFMTKPIKNQQFDGGLNAYCGTISIVLLFVYLLHGKVKLWDKIKNVILLAVIAISFNNVLLNYIWHGFHDQYGIPNRFSFLFIFILLAVGCEALVKLEKKSIVTVLLGVAASCVFMIFAFKKCSLEKGVVIGTQVFLGIYAVLIVAMCLGRDKMKKLVSGILVIVCLTETVINGIKGYDSNGVVNIDYYFGEEKEIREAINYLDCKDKPYRVEMMNTTIVDEPTYYNLKSVCLFGSTVSADLVDAMHDLGFYTGANEFLYDGANVVSNAIMGVKYLLQREDDYNYFDMEYVDNVSGINIYSNPYALSTGFMVNENLMNWNGEGHMFNTLNSFVENATGVPGVFCQIYPNITAFSDNCEISHDGEVSEYYSYERTDDSECNFQLSFVVEEEASDIYILATSNGINKVRIYIDGVECNYERLQNQTYHVGHLVKDQQVTVEYCFPDNQSDSGRARLVVSELNWDSFLQAYEKFSANQMIVGEFEDGYVKGYMDIDEPGLMFTSIPYDDGWTVYVDGEKTEVKAVGKAFIAIHLEAGEHTIELKYFPPGLKLGLLISFLGLLLLSLLYSHFFDRLFGKKNKDAEDESSSEDADDEDSSEDAEGENASGDMDGGSSAEDTAGENSSEDVDDV